MRHIIIIALIAALVLGSEIASGMGIFLIVEGTAEEEGLASQTVVPQDDWREAHINGAQRLRSIGHVVLPVLLLTAGVLSFISPEKKGSGEDFWDDDFSF